MHPVWNTQVSARAHATSHRFSFITGHSFAVGAIPPVTVATKGQLRCELRRRRACLVPDEQRQAAERLAANLAGTHWFRTACAIACYLPHDGEIDTAAVIERILRAGKRCYLPVLARRDHDRLWFAEYRPGVRLRPNRFGIPEPVVPARALVRARALDLVLLPLVAFDTSGHRLGMGSGYYDRSLAFLRLQRHWRRPYPVGLGYDFQRVESLPADPWDVPLVGVVTDRQVYVTANP